MSIHYTTGICAWKRCVVADCAYIKTADKITNLPACQAHRKKLTINHNIYKQFSEKASTALRIIHTTRRDSLQKILLYHRAIMAYSSEQALRKTQMRSLKKRFRDKGHYERIDRLTEKMEQMRNEIHILSPTDSTSIASSNPSMSSMVSSPSTPKVDKSTSDANSNILGVASDHLPKPKDSSSTAPPPSIPKLHKHTSDTSLSSPPTTTSPPPKLKDSSSSSSMCSSPSAPKLEKHTAGTSHASPPCPKPKDSSSSSSSSLSTSVSTSASGSASSPSAPAATPIQSIDRSSSSSSAIYPLPPPVGIKKSSLYLSSARSTGSSSSFLTQPPVLRISAGLSPESSIAFMDFLGSHDENTSIPILNLVHTLGKFLQIPADQIKTWKSTRVKGKECIVIQKNADLPVEYAKLQLMVGSIPNVFMCSCSMVNDIESETMKSKNESTHNKYFGLLDFREMAATFFLQLYIMSLKKIDYRFEIFALYHSFANLLAKEWTTNKPLQTIIIKAQEDKSSWTKEEYTLYQQVIKILCSESDLVVKRLQLAELDFTNFSGPFRTMAKNALYVSSCSSIERQKLLSALKTKFSSKTSSKEREISIHNLLEVYLSRYSAQLESLFVNLSLAAEHISSNQCLFVFTNRSEEYDAIV